MSVMVQKRVKHSMLFSSREEAQAYIDGALFAMGNSFENYRYIIDPRVVENEDKTFTAFFDLLKRSK